MDLYDILEEFIPWLILLGLWWPAIKKLVKNSKGRDVPPPVMPDTQNAVLVPEQNVNPLWPESAEIKHHKPPRKINTTKNNKPENDITKNPRPLPEEGVSAIPHKPMTTTVDKPRATGPQRELRRALVIGEILQRKF